MRDTINKGRFFIFHMVGQEGVYIGIGSIYKGLKPPFLYMLPTIQVLVEYAMYVSQCMEGFLSRELDL